MSALGQKRTFKRLLDMLVSAPGRMLKLAGITMKLPRRKFLTWALVPAAAALVEVPRIDAWSQSARSIRVVLPFAPGGPADAMARLLAEQIGSAKLRMSAMGQKQTSEKVQLMSALPPIADIPENDWDVRLVPKADLARADFNLGPSTERLGRKYRRVRIGHAPLHHRR